MNRLLLSLGIALVAFSPVRAEVSVTLKDLHMCCGGCAKAIEEVIGKVEGAKVSVDRDAASATITAPDMATARKAVNAVGKAGFHGKSDQKKLSIKSAKVPEGKVEQLTVVGFHNCCGACARELGEVAQKVEGVKEVQVAAREKVMTVTGEFDAQALVGALHEAGFNARIKKNKKDQ